METSSNILSNFEGAPCSKIDVGIARMSETAQALLLTEYLWWNGCMAHTMFSSVHCEDCPWDSTKCGFV